MAEQRYRHRTRPAAAAGPSRRGLVCRRARIAAGRHTDLRNQCWKDSRDAIQFDDDGTVSVDLPEGLQPGGSSSR